VQARVHRWGNSLAIRIPKPFAHEVGLDSDSPIELSVSHGKLIVAPTPAGTYRLEDLLRGVKPGRRQREVSFGPPVGREVW
jgi:antitoxin MazE